MIVSKQEVNKASRKERQLASKHEEAEIKEPRASSEITHKLDDKKYFDKLMKSYATGD